MLIWFRVRLTVAVTVANKRVTTDTLHGVHLELYHFPRSPELFGDKIKSD